MSPGKTWSPASVTIRLENAGMYSVGVNCPITVVAFELLLLNWKWTDCARDVHAKSSVTMHAETTLRHNKWMACMERIRRYTARKKPLQMLITFNGHSSRFGTPTRDSPRPDGAKCLSSLRLPQQQPEHDEKPRQRADEGACTGSPSGACRRAPRPLGPGNTP